MSALTFTLKKTVQTAVNCKNLTPDFLQSKTIADINAIKLATNLTVADVFEITGENTNILQFNQVNQHLHYIGYKMRSGTVIVQGDAGDFIGAEMQGGVLICKGNAGSRAGDAMRRGLLLIEGNVGDYCASNMKAGTLGLLGASGAHLGYGMKRGTLLVVNTPKPQATWLNCGTLNLPFLKILYKSFASLDTQFATLNQTRVNRWVGDVSGLGKAEILELQTD
jgi:formylmethanofuran dehydrogenase subunit C